MKRLTAGLLCLAALLVVGCGGGEADIPGTTGPDSPAPSGDHIRYYEIPDGRTVMCVFESEYLGNGSGSAIAGLSCDWDGAK